MKKVIFHIPVAIPYITAYISSSHNVLKTGIKDVLTPVNKSAILNIIIL